MKPVRLFRDFFNLYAYSFWKVCHRVRLFKTIRLLEISEYVRAMNKQGQMVSIRFTLFSENCSRQMLFPRESQVMTGLNRPIGVGYSGLIYPLRLWLWF